MQSHEKQNFLQICFNPARGLRLDWKFKDLTASERYFRHIFVVVTQKQDQILSILESLVKKMKSGDLFCCIYPHDSYIFKTGRWVEKSQLNSFNAERYFRDRSKRSLESALKTKLIDAAGKQSLEFDEPVLVNFLGVQNNQVDFYRNEIMRHRFSLNGSYQYIVNLFGDFEHNHISVHSGINMFRTQVPNFSDHAEYYHKTMNSAVVQSAHLDLTSESGVLSLFNQTYWKNSDFNRISADYYGPSSRFDSETIYFFNRDENTTCEYEFDIRLKIKLFQGKVLDSQKRIKLSFKQNIDYCPTVKQERFKTCYQEKDIVLFENPNRCELLVRFKPNDPHNHSSDTF